MNQIEKYSDRELQEMKELCIKLINREPGHYPEREYRAFKTIAEIALVEINREIDIKASR